MFFITCLAKLCTNSAFPRAQTSLHRNPSLYPSTAICVSAVKPGGPSVKLRFFCVMRGIGFPPEGVRRGCRFSQCLHPFSSPQQHIRLHIHRCYWFRKRRWFLRSASCLRRSLWPRIPPPICRQSWRGGRPAVVPVRRIRRTVGIPHQVEVSREIVLSTRYGFFSVNPPISSIRSLTAEAMTSLASIQIRANLPQN